MKHSENSEHMNREGRELHHSETIDARAKQMSTSSSSTTTYRQNVSHHHNREHDHDLEESHNDNNNKRRANLVDINSNRNVNSVSNVVFGNLFAEREVSTDTPSASMLPNEKR